MSGKWDGWRVGVLGSPSPALLLCFVSLLFGLIVATAGGAEVLPAAPERYFNDYAPVVSPATGEHPNRVLEDFEKATSSQILVAIYPKMQSDSGVEDYTVRVARSWRVGQKARNNGAILFVFVQDHKMRIEVGYGLEGAMPDAIAKRIIEEDLKPHFQRGDYDGGIVAGVNAMLQAARGEYKGTSRTVGQGKSRGSWQALMFFGIIGIIILSAIRRAAARGTVYGSSGRAGYWGGAGWFLGGMGSGGGWSGGGGGGGGGGGFSGGGGSFGGGGASGSW